MKIDLNDILLCEEHFAAAVLEEVEGREVWEVLNLDMTPVKPIRRGGYIEIPVCEAPDCEMSAVVRVWPHNMRQKAPAVVGSQVVFTGRLFDVVAVADDKLTLRTFNREKTIENVPAQFCTVLERTYEDERGEQ